MNDRVCKLHFNADDIIRELKTDVDFTTLQVAGKIKANAKTTSFCCIMFLK